MKNEKRFLRYTFSQDEILAIGKDLARFSQEHQAIDNERKAIASQYKAKLDEKQADIEKASNHINSGFEYRNVMCQVEFNTPGPGRKTIIRTDTGEMLPPENMTSEELQKEIPFPENKTLLVDELAGFDFIGGSGTDDDPARFRPKEEPQVISQMTPEEEERWNAIAKEEEEGLQNEK